MMMEEFGHGDVRQMIHGALELLRVGRDGRKLTMQSMENLVMCDRAETLATGAGDVLVCLTRGRRKGFLHFDDGIATFRDQSAAEAFVRRYRADLLEEGMIHA